MQRGQAQVPVSAGDGVVLVYMDFADQDHVGAWRKVFFRATPQFSVSTPTSRWVTMQFLLVLFHRIFNRDDVAVFFIA